MHCLVCHWQPVACLAFLKMSNSDDSDDFNNGKDRRQSRQGAGGGLVGASGLVIALLALAGVIGLCIWHGLDSRGTHDAIRRLEQESAQSNLTISDLQHQAMTANMTIGYLQTVIGTQGLGGNSTVLEQGVCGIASFEIEYPFGSLINYADSGTRVNYTVSQTPTGVYVVFSNFSVPASVPSYPFSRPVLWPECDALHLEVQHLVSFAFVGCTQDPTGATFTQSLLNDVLLYGVPQFILRTEQAKFEFDGPVNTVKLFGNMAWWETPPTCFENQYTVQQTDSVFSPARTNMYIFNVGVANVTTTVRLAEPVMLLLSASNVK